MAETHIHADYLSGARELASAVGARLYLSDEGGAAWRYAGLDVQLVRDGDDLSFGAVQVTVWHTPGYTPEHVAFVVTDGGRGDEPAILLSGDFVFVGDVGRPDLLERAAGIAGTAQVGAEQLFASLRDRFLALPDHVQVCPGHGAGSACGKSLGAVTSTTVGYERRMAWWAAHLANGAADDFAAELLDGQPESPTYFAEMKRLNRDGMLILGELPSIPTTSWPLTESYEGGSATVVDVRRAGEFAEGHIEGAVSVPRGRLLSTWAGWLLPYDRPLLVAGADDGLPDDVRLALLRVGLERIVGYLPMHSLPRSALVPTPQLDTADAYRRWLDARPLLLDVRSRAEFATGHIPGALNIHVGELRTRIAELPSDGQIVVYCESGVRSALATSVLLGAGRAASDVRGGMRAWRSSGYPIEEPTARAA